MTNLTSQALFFIGFFSALLSYFIFRLLLLNRKVSKIDHRVLALICFLFCFIISFLSFDTRTVSLVIESPGKVSNAGIRYCSTPDKKKLVEKKPGCELMYRAFELGLIADLGSCSGSEQNEQLCSLRQYDEPWAHYSARLFSGFLAGIKKRFEVPDLKEEIKTTFARQLEHTNVLVGKLLHVVKSAPKASHHIYTNLPYPDGAFKYYWNRWFNPKECLTNYRNLAHTIETSDSQPQSSSKVFEHTFAQMLFNPQYSATVGSCLEYTIHWNSPEDTCQKLASAPESFIKASGINGEVKTVLNRLSEQKDFHSLQYQLIFFPFLKQHKAVPPSAADIEKVIPKVGVDLSPDQVISFQCFMKIPNGDGIVKSIPFYLYDYPFEAREMKYAQTSQIEKIQVSLFKKLSSLLSSDFNYAGFLSNESSNLAAINLTDVSPSTFDQGTYPLTRLEYLKDVDIFLGHEWVQEREDLLEIYPYYYHLYNFIDVFRKQYHSQRTRL